MKHLDFPVLAAAPGKTKILHIRVRIIESLAHGGLLLQLAGWYHHIAAVTRFIARARAALDDGSALRQRLCAAHGLREGNRFQLLAAIGGDLPGAVEVHPSRSTRDRATPTPKSVKEADGLQDEAFGLPNGNSG